MDIRIIDERNKRVVNVSRLSLEVQGKYVVGLTDEQKQVLVKGCYDEQEAERLMDRIIVGIKSATSDIVINL